MSGIFGIFNRNGKPVSSKIIHKMLDAMTYWNPDDYGTWINGSVALGHTMLWNTPESKFEQLPNVKDFLTITIDARLDNREDLAAKLDMSSLPIERITDSDFILNAYQKWGEDCPRYLLGDFAFVIWDEKEKRLFCARDHVGIKPLYCHYDNDVFVFSNDIRGVVAHPNVPSEFNELAILKYLYDVEDQTHTFFSTIKPLLPASTMTVEKGDVSPHVYWQLEDSPEVRFATVDEYTHCLRELLDNAVQARTRSLFPVASHLSGGLDSSTVAVLAARHLRKERKNLYAFNWVHPPGVEDDWDHYEWSYSRKLAARERIIHEYVDLTAEKLVEFYTEQDMSLNDRQYLWYEQIVRRKAKKKGVRTVLSGWGGDELITHNGRAFYTGMFWMGHPLDALAGLFRDSKTADHPMKNFLGKCYNDLVFPLLQDKFYQHFTGMRQCKWDVLQCTQEDFYLSTKKREIADNHCSRMSTRRNQIDLFNQGHLQNRIDSWVSSAFTDRMEYRYPLLDKRIVEFALGIPSSLYKSKGYGRYIFRKTVEGILPREICWGAVKSEPARVALLYDLMFEAQNLWKNKVNNTRFFSHSSTVVSLEKVVNLIDITKKEWGSLGQEKRLENLLIIYRSIMILNLGRDVVR